MGTPLHNQYCFDDRLSWLTLLLERRTFLAYALYKIDRLFWLILLLERRTFLANALITFIKSTTDFFALYTNLKPLAFSQLPFYQLHNLFNQPFRKTGHFFFTSNDLM